METQHLVGLLATNFKRLTAVRIDIDPKKPNGVLRIVGKNTAGKSSILDAISAALLGEKYSPDKPVRKGAKKAHIVLQTEDLIISRTFTDNDGEIGGGLTVKDRDGRNFSSPQKLLDKLCSTVGFDPLSFARMGEMPGGQKKQAEELLKVCPIALDLDKNAADQKEAYEERRDWNRSVKDASAQVESLPDLGDDVPDAEVSIAELTKQLSDARGKQREIDQRASEVSTHQERIKARGEQIQQLKDRIAAMEADQKASQRIIDNLSANPEEGDIIAGEIKRLEEELQKGEVRNRKVRVKLARRAAEKQLDDMKAKAATAEEKYDRCVKERADALKAAKFPVDGLSLDEEGNVTFNGVPFSQASTAEQIKVGIAIAAYHKPTLKLGFIRDGSLLDSDSMQVLESMAEQHGFLFLAERVDDNSPASIQIVDGSTPGAVVEEEPKDAPEETDPKASKKTKKPKSSGDAPSPAAALFFE